MIRSTLRGLVAVTALLAAVNTSAQAQQAADSRFGVTAGLALPMGDFGDLAGLGFQLGGHIQMPLVSTLKLRVNADYGRYGGNDNVGIDNTTLLGAVANVVLPITTTSALKPYVYGGLGFYNWKMEGSGGGSVDGSDLAFNVGVGYDFEFSGKNLFTELRFLSVQTEGSSLNSLPIVIGLRF